MANKNVQEWYVTDADVYEQLENYITENGILVLPELLEYVAVCK